MPFDDEARRRRAGQRHRVRPVRLDLHQRPRPRAPGRPRGRGRQPQRQLALARCATGRRSAATSSPASAASSARTRRTRSPRRRTSSSPTSTTALDRGRNTWQDASQGKVAVVTGGCSGIGLATVQPVRRGGRAGRHRRHRRRARARAGRGARRQGVATYVHVDVTEQGEVDALFRDRQGRPTASVDIAFNNAGISPARRRLDPRHRAGRLAPGAGGQPDQRLPVLQGRAALHARAGPGSIINTASFVAVMGAATSQISYSASKGGVLSMTRELGVQFARDGRPGQRALPGPGQHPAAPGAVRQGPGARRPPAGARADGPVRRARGDGQRRAVPGLRRVVASSPRTRSWSTAASPAPTSRPSD